ncbi:membrane associated with 11 transmembrane domains regions [Cryptosporidium sp. chipmunk genotype I]|uniref:membrane associated with 11 transmembrane domains regions n=1 Tax=Cryptosporidium sp. chipmunk genotype I TaxID=1280935 RepID=UPI00351A8BEB|nr:membrane associated with 11 transmembrane domains regions [Cryptosporidium sp. chipmunk genotype I]
MNSNIYIEETKKDESLEDFLELQLTIQVGISLWTIFLFHCSHTVVFNGVIFPVAIDRGAFLSYYTVDLLNIAVPLYFYSHGWKLVKIGIFNFQYYLNYHMKYLLPGFVYGLLIFIIKNFDKLEPATQSSIPIPDENWSWSVPYRLGLISIFIYHFLVAMVMYPVICIIKKCYNYHESYVEYEYGIISSSDLIARVDKDFSENEISKRFALNQNYYINYNSSNSNLPYIISNIIIYFLIINIFFYFSYGAHVYIIYTFFYLSIFLIYSLKFIQKEMSISGICIFMNIAYISLYAYLTSGISKLAFNNGTVFFNTFFLFLIYYFTGFTMAFSDSILRIQKYYLDLLLLIPILYNFLSIPNRTLMYSPLIFPISFQEGDQTRTIISSWIGIIFTISIVFRFFRKCSIKRKVKIILEKIPYILIISVTMILFIYERARQVENGLYSKL